MLSKSELLISQKNQEVSYVYFPKLAVQKSTSYVGTRYYSLVQSILLVKNSLTSQGEKLLTFSFRNMNIAHTLLNCHI